LRDRPDGGVGGADPPSATSAVPNPFHSSSPDGFWRSTPNVFGVSFFAIVDAFAVVLLQG